MDYQKVINFKLNTLIDLMLTKGVSPSELADNIFDEDYLSISFSKTNEYIVGKLNFFDKGEVLQNIYMLYTYSKDKRLVQIEEIVNGDKHLLWSRRSREEELITELLYFMNCCYNAQQIDEFISSLPEELKDIVVKYANMLSA